MAIFIPLVTKFDDKGLQGLSVLFLTFRTLLWMWGVWLPRLLLLWVWLLCVRLHSLRLALRRFRVWWVLLLMRLVSLRMQLEGLGPQFGVSANEAADALFFITSAGLRGAGATEVLEASLKGAAIGLGDTKTIADLATSAVNAYGESTLGGAEAVDVLAEAVRLGKLEPAELAGLWVRCCLWLLTWVCA
jgi:hypothetical protein